MLIILLNSNNTKKKERTIRNVDLVSEGVKLSFQIF